MDSTQLRRRALRIAAAIPLVAYPLFAEAGDRTGGTAAQNGRCAVEPASCGSSVSDEAAREAARLAQTIRAGDELSITRWTGKKLRGRAADVTACAVVLTAPGQSIEVPIASIKTVRRHFRAQPNLGARAMLDTANQCSEVSCAPAAMAFVGLAAAFQGFDTLLHPPKVVYRAAGRLAAPAACPAAPDHSSLSATTGSTRVARRAGR